MADIPEWAVLDAALTCALDLDAFAREAYLESLEPSLREALAPVLHAALSDDPVLDHPPVLGGLPEEQSECSVQQGTRVGPYRVEELIGEGGMGRVYRARRADGAFDQTVALKVVRQSLVLAGTDAGARLRRERALLATLNHPGIARLIDGGETDDGVPYLVTELVDGTPITVWASEQGFDLRTRVRLLTDVARAVEHAHQRFVVHRDLKPSNVLVAERDGAPRPVVLDFGIAKLLDTGGNDGPEAFPLTRTGARLLTPAYAAPELYDPAATVTTAADVYGLGAILYELLTGLRLHDGTGSSMHVHGGARSFAEPSRPSRAVAELAGQSGKDSDLAVRSRLLRGDLDVICLRALHPDPARRYMSAAALADDLERFLAGDPIKARQDSTAYVVGRIVRRHRTLVVAGALALVGLVGGLAMTVTSLGEERQARAEAEAAAELFAGLLSEADPERVGDPDRTVREALDQGLGRIDQVPSASLRGVLLGRVGEVYAGIGDVATADSLLALALPLVASAPPDGEDRVRVAYADTRLRLGDPVRAAALFQTVVSSREPADSLRVRALTGLLLTLEPGPQADTVAADLTRAANAAEWAGVRADALLGLGLYYVWTLERPEEGVGPARRARRLLTSLRGPDHRSTRIATGTWAKALSMMGQTDRALVLYQEMIAATRRIHGLGSRDEAYVQIAIADANREVGRLEEAADAYEIGLSLVYPHLPDDHPDLGWWHQSLANVYNRLGIYASAEAHALRARDIARAVGSKPMNARAIGQLGLALVGQRRGVSGRQVLNEAEALLSQPTGLGPSYDRDHAEVLRRVREALGTEELGEPARARGRSTARGRGGVRSTR